jgi:excisionase family DNA binding protein
MRSLAEWYRYVDQVSRPANREDEDLEPVIGWRPWLDPVEPEEAPAPAAMSSVPDLSDLFGGAANAEAASAAQHQFEDLTVHDELPAIPEFRVPDLQVPSFELSVVRWGEMPDLSEPEEEADSRELAEMGAKGGAIAPATTASRIKASPNWDLLAQIRGEKESEGGRARTGESRQELIERLVDPTLSLEETAVILGVCSTTVRRYTNKGILRHFRTKGNQRRFRLSDVVEFMDTRAAEIEADGAADRAAGLHPSS